MKISNIKKIKSTVLGLILITVAIILLLKGITFDYYIIGGLLVIGLSLIFSGDKFINKLEEKLFGSSITLNKNEDGK